MKRIVFLVSLSLVIIVSAVFIAKYYHKGKVIGDIYVTMKSGDTKKAAGGEVVLYKVDNPEAKLQEINNATKQFLESVVVPMEEMKELTREGKEKSDAGYSTKDTALMELSLDLLKKAVEKGLYLKKLNAEQNSKINGILTPLLFKKSNTDVNGHYEFLDIPYGKYIVYSHHSIFEKDIEWLYPIEVNNKENRIDLTNSNKSNGVFFYTDEDN